MNLFRPDESQASVSLYSLRFKRDARPPRVSKTAEHIVTKPIMSWIPFVMCQFLEARAMKPAPRVTAIERTPKTE